MALLYTEQRSVLVYCPDLGFVPFVAKVQKAKTRKNKDYFILRVSVPKDVAKKIDAQAGEYLFFKAKKAEWYHMLDWSKMETTWQMLPNGIKNQTILEGLSYPGAEDQISTVPRQAFGTTSPSGSISFQPPIQQVVGIQTGQR